MSSEYGEYATPHEFHQRREGEPVGYVPEVGDMIRYRLRHDHPGNDRPGHWSETKLVRGSSVRDGATETTFWCAPADRPNAKDASSWIQLDWWECERVVEEGALF